MNEENKEIDSAKSTHSINQQESVQKGKFSDERRRERIAGTKVGATVEKTEATQETVPVDLSRTRRRMMTSLDFLKDQCRIMEERKRRREEEDEAVNGPKKIKAIQGDFRFSIRVPAVENPQASNRNVSLYSSSDEYEGEAPSQEDIMDSVFPDFLEDAQSADGVEDELSQETGNEFGFSVRTRSTQGTIPGTPIGSSSVSDFEEDAPRQGVVGSIFGDLLHRNDDNPPAEQEHFDISTPPETADGNYDWGARGCWVVRK
ncbi:hypothetical protein QR680_004366 [Steinernema hermaphroditum]|uniref:Uncharacterized protein n=1 Tax=Steinernema hermaphroditum TaxID=289476 RepID=A0AA39LTV6_9BILA|nr:hypothetical protein QR680_004366 [Steinernema hermaphroditum]